MKEKELLEIEKLNRRKKGKNNQITNGTTSTNEKFFLPSLFKLNLTLIFKFLHINTYNQPLYNLYHTYLFVQQIRNKTINKIIPINLLFNQLNILQTYCC